MRRQIVSSSIESDPKKILQVQIFLSLKLGTDNVEWIETENWYLWYLVGLVFFIFESESNSLYSPVSESNPPKSW